MKRVALGVLLLGLVLRPASRAAAQEFPASPAGWSAALDFVDDAYVKRDGEAVETWLWEGMEGNDREEFEVTLEQIADTSSLEIEVRAVLLRAPGGELESLAAELVKVFLAARFSDADRHRRRLGKVTALEKTCCHE